jgi:TfoX/Sxy family transcriptional regulator of competence genes
MTADDDLAAMVRASLEAMATVREVRMFGGTAFMLDGNMLAAASKRGLLVRVGKARQPDALSRPGARPMEMRGRVMEGYVYVDPPALTKDAMRQWLREALAFVRTLPPKNPKVPKASSGEKPAKMKGKPK